MILIKSSLLWFTIWVFVTMTSAAVLPDALDDDVNSLLLATEDNADAEMRLVDKLLSRLNITAKLNLVPPSGYSQLEREVEEEDLEDLLRLIGDQFGGGAINTLESELPSVVEQKATNMIARNVQVPNLRSLAFQEQPLASVEKRNPEGELLKNLRRLRRINRARYLHNHIKHSVFRQLARYK